MCSCMVRKQRVETYLDPDDAEALDSLDVPNSEFVREATLKELARTGSVEATSDD